MVYEKISQLLNKIQALFSQIIYFWDRKLLKEQFGQIKPLCSRASRNKSQIQIIAISHLHKYFFLKTIKNVYIST